MSKSLRTLLIIWLAWAVILIAFQNVLPMRLALRKPDYVLSWTPTETGTHSQDDKPYLIDKFMNQQVAWDSEYYLSIAVGGYDDPVMRRIPIHATGELISQNYAFFPLYPYVMRVVMLPLWLLGLTQIGTATLAGVIVAVVGTLFGLIGLYDLARDELGEEGGLPCRFLRVDISGGLLPGAGLYRRLIYRVVLLRAGVAAPAAVVVGRYPGRTRGMDPLGRCGTGYSVGTGMAPGCARTAFRLANIAAWLDCAVTGGRLRSVEPVAVGGELSRGRRELFRSRPVADPGFVAAMTRSLGYHWRT